MYYLIIALIIVAGVFAGYGAFVRRKIYKEIDRFESWKIDIMNRPVTKEISRVKDLNVIGDTEEKFASWRNEWDDIVTAELPSVEEKLFDAEEFADKYRFRKTRNLLNSIHEKLTSIESRIDQMLEDLNEVVDSEQQNRSDIINVKESYHAIKKRMITRPDEFQDAIKYLETGLKQLDSRFEAYEHETDSGNYIKAREILLGIKEHLDMTEQEMEQIPKCYKDIRIVVPNRMRELENGLADMYEQGYQLDHLKIDESINTIEKHLKVYEKSLINGEVEHVMTSIKETFEQFEWVYDQLNKEVESRQQLIDEAPVLQRDIEIVGDKIDKLANETQIVRDAYKVEEADIKKQQDIQQAYDHLEAELYEVTSVIETKKQAFSILLEKVEDMRLHVDTLRDEADGYKERIDTLRKDEKVAKETLANLKQDLGDTRRRIEKSNLPGVPQANVALIEEATDLLQEVSGKLDEKPLDMPTVNRLLSDTEHVVQDANKKSVVMVEEGSLAERLIQYGNRYRSTKPSVDEELRKAEDYFRHYNYRDAVEVAAGAIQKVDDSALKEMGVELEYTGS